MAHQSIFPPSSSSSSSETEESEKETEEDSDNERMGMMGRSRKVQSRPKKAHKLQEHEMDDEDEVDGYMLSPSELNENNNGQRTTDDLEEPLLGPDELDHTRQTPGGKTPVRLQVYHGRFGHWEREGLRKYKDSGFLALWLTSIMGVVFGLFFVWGSTDVRLVL